MCCVVGNGNWLWWIRGGSGYPSRTYRRVSDVSDVTNDGGLMDFVLPDQICRVAEQKMSLKKTLWVMYSRRKRQRWRRNTNTHTNANQKNKNAGKMKQISQQKKNDTILSHFVFHFFYCLRYFFFLFSGSCAQRNFHSSYRIWSPTMHTPKTGTSF